MKIDNWKGVNQVGYYSDILETVISSFSIFFFSSRRRHTRFDCDWSSDVCSSDLPPSVSELRDGRIRSSGARRSRTVAGRCTHRGWGAGATRSRARRGDGDCNRGRDRKSTRLNSSHSQISYAVFCLKKKKKIYHTI